MSFAENLQYLRKQSKITQEDLAEELGVSRQAVSKWETGEAYPETEKLIALCDKFNVDMDTITRGDVAAEVVQDNEGYIRHMNDFSLKISLGVFLVLFGVALCVAVSGAGVGKASEELIVTLSAVVVLIFVAAAVFLFVYAGISHDAYTRKYPEMKEVFTEKQLTEFNKKFTLVMSLLVAAVLVDVAALVTAFAILGDRAETNENVALFITSGFLAVLSPLVAGLCYMGMQHTKYNVSEYNKEAKTRSGHAVGGSHAGDGGVCGKINGAIMLLATAAFLVCGFIWGLWHPAWIVFPIGGILCAIIDLLFGKGKK